MGHVDGVVARSGGLCLAAAALLAWPAFADVMVQSYPGARMEALASGNAAAGTFSALGMERFDTRPVTGNAGGAGFSTDFGTSGAITGTYSGAFGIHAADQYGGAGGRGRYAVTFDQGAGYTLRLGHDASVPGINHFGMALSALDGGNFLDFYRGGSLVYSYTPANLIKTLGACPGPYRGNPTSPAQNTKEQYAFINFFDQSGTFDQVTFHQGAGFGGGYESDNHTVGYRTTNAVFGLGIPVPEPAGLGLIGAGLVGLGMLGRRRHGMG